MNEERCCTPPTGGPRDGFHLTNLFQATTLAFAREVDACKFAEKISSCRVITTCCFDVGLEPAQSLIAIVYGDRRGPHQVYAVPRCALVSRIGARDLAAIAIILLTSRESQITATVIQAQAVAMVDINAQRVGEKKPVHRDVPGAGPTERIVPSARTPHVIPPDGPHKVDIGRVDQTRCAICQRYEKRLDASCREPRLLDRRRRAMRRRKVAERTCGRCRQLRGEKKAGGRGGAHRSVLPIRGLAFRFAKPCSGLDIGYLVQDNPKIWRRKSRILILQPSPNRRLRYSDGDSDLFLSLAASPSAQKSVTLGNHRRERLCVCA